MKVILLENIEKLGKKYEVVEVTDGYARNFLLPQKKGQLATKGNLKNLEKIKEGEEKKKKKEKKEVEELISKLEGKEFTIKTKAGEKDQLYESITAKKIANKLQEEGYDIEEKNIVLDKPIKNLTEKEIEISFDYDLTTNININIKEEE